jgi:hypothetical protein
MRTLIDIVDGLDILTNAVIYSTDVFSAIIPPPPSPWSTIAPLHNCSATSRAGGRRSSHPV